VSDPLDLARRLRDLVHPQGRRKWTTPYLAVDGHFCDWYECDWPKASDELLTDAADLIESQHAEIERLRDIEKAARELADFAYTFKAYPQGLAGQDPLAGVSHEDVLELRALASALREKGVEK